MGNNQKHSCESNLVPHPPRKKIYKSIYKSHFSPFRSHSGSFRSHSGLIPVHSGPFRSVPVFSNALHIVPQHQPLVDLIFVNTLLLMKANKQCSSFEYFIV